jgi:predicted peptidase
LALELVDQLVASKPVDIDRLYVTGLSMGGQADNVVPVSRGREMMRALVDAGHHPEMRYVEYPKVGHNSWTQTYARDDVYAWLFSQHKK